MPSLPNLIDDLRSRIDVTVEDQNSAWLIRVPKGDGLTCEITIPFRVIEWFVDVKRSGEAKPICSDWADYTGYDDTPEDILKATMANDISKFIQKVTSGELVLPLKISE